MLDVTKGALSGVVSGGIYLASTSIDGNSLVPIGAAITIVLAVAGAVWKVSQWKTTIELKMEAFKNERRYDAAMIDHKAHDPNHTKPTPPTPVEEMYRATVLIVDDDPNDRFVARRNLERHRFVVLESKTLQEARETLTNHTVDCVLLDLSLPDSHKNHTMADFLREFPKAICIALTGSEDPDLQAQVLAQGADAFVYKADTADPNYLPRMIQKAMVHRAIKRQSKER